MREKNSGTVSCQYGNITYNTRYILSEKLYRGNCAVNPNLTYNTPSATNDYKSLVTKLRSMGFELNSNKYFNYRSSIYSVKNTSGTGLVGYQITIYVKVIDPDNLNSYMSAEYIIKPDGTRKIISNTIKKNGMSFS